MVQDHKSYVFGVRLHAELLHKRRHDFWKNCGRCGDSFLYADELRGFKMGEPRVVEIFCGRSGNPFSRLIPNNPVIEPSGGYKQAINFHPKDLK